ncbi:uncharacterized protein LOC126799886 [Argentina anserina]|uniref:uncharacterized protein LOC126799886 n=1 Tax=Argentina anserina TaxID=57926 RepID=UPI0021767EDF|nr:uncharacterized protein LOC126799886 [Potentilla anserina]
MDDYYKRSGQIPAFGDWDYANELPITQYFECARQAGLIRFSSSSGESDAPAAYLHADLYAVDVMKMKKKPSRIVAPNSRKTIAIGREKRCTHNPHVKEQKKLQHHAKVHDDVTEPSRKLHYQQCHTRSNDAVLRPRRPPKPVDEDLYKIPPELLHSTKRKKMLGLFSCLVPACAS